jgi:hypothetical protein
MTPSRSRSFRIDFASRASAIAAASHFRQRPSSPIRSTRVAGPIEAVIG